MTEIFRYVDTAGVTLRVEAMEDGRILVRRPHSTVRVDREGMKALWLALGEVLHLDASTAPLPYANQSLIEQLIERAVKDQVAAVLPLHRAPMAAVCGTTGCQMTSQPDPEPHDVGHADEPVARCDGTACCTPHPLDPEPHPTEDEWAQAPGRLVTNEGVPLPYCKESSGGCGHSWGQHTGGECKARDFDLEARTHTPCGCTQVRDYCECGHAWADHGRFNIRGCGVLPCECSRAVPRAEAKTSAPAKCTCFHNRQMHGPHGCGYLGECACKYVGDAS